MNYRNTRTGQVLTNPDYDPRAYGAEWVPVRKDYGCPLRVYAGWSTVPVYHALPPRSERAADKYAAKLDGLWAAVRVARWPAGEASYRVRAKPGPHLGQRIAWAELPEPVQRALRASFLGEYCPKEEA